MTQHSATDSSSSVSPPLEVKIYQHSMLLYWWPVWVLGFIMAAITRLGGERVVIGGETMWFHPSRNVGVVYLTVVLFVFLVTHTSIKGALASVILTVFVAASVLFAVLGWWDDLFSLERHLSIHMDFGFYLIVSTVLFLLWGASLLFFDRLTYSVFTPGQLTEKHVLGGGSRTYDTRGMAIYRLRADPFRHWSLGLGSGDVHVATTGAEKVALEFRNVLFVERKLAMVKQLSAMSPENLSDLTKSGSSPATDSDPE